MTTLEMWKIGDVELNLGRVVGTTHGVSLWRDGENGWYDYTDEGLYRYRHELGIEVTNVDIQDNLSYLDDFVKTKYTYTTYRRNIEGKVEEPEESFMYLPEFICDMLSFPRYGCEAYYYDEKCIYLFLFICYIWLKYDVKMDKLTMRQYGFDDSIDLTSTDDIVVKKDGNHLNVYDYERSKITLTVEDLKGLIAMKDVNQLIATFLGKFKR